MTRVKICGITCLEDALTAIDLGAHALGFVMEPSSPRYAGGAESVDEILSRLPPYVVTVAVFGPPPTAALPFGIHAVQCAGTMEVPLPRGTKFIYTHRMGAENGKTNGLTEFPSTADAVLIDAWHPEAYGGTGKTVDWGAAARLRGRLANLPMVLAGGLTPDNVEEAVRQVRPFAVDVSSGVERLPGRKDAEKIRRFIEAVLRADRA